MDSLSLFREVWEMLVQDRPADFPVRRSQNDQTVALLPESEVLVVGMVVLSLVGETPPPGSTPDLYQDNPCEALKVASVATSCSPRADENWASLGHSVRLFFTNKEENDVHASCRFCVLDPLSKAVDHYFSLSQLPVL